MKPKYYITTPIYYVNDAPHIGHTYTEIAADALARWKRLQGYEVRFLTGTDEHGMKIASSAAAMGREPQEHVDINCGKFVEAWEKMGISYDDFIRTTQERHKKTIQAVFSRLHEKGDIYKGTYQGWYCKPCEAYWTEFQLQDKKVCPDCGRPVEKIEEEAYFFALSRYQDRLLSYINSHPDFIRPASRRNEVVNFIQSGLKDLNVSRTNFSWGIQVPFNPGHVIYVWFDALINYISAIGYPQDMEEFSKWWPADVHLMGKEIVRFHAVIWPAILMALDLPLPGVVFGHGWWTVEGQKMSKSVGNVVDPVALSEEFGLDAVRYFLMREVPFGSDGDFSRQALISRYNSDLANDLGNLLSRTLTMIDKYFGGTVPKAQKLTASSQDAVFSELIIDTPKKYEQAMDEILPSEALACVWGLISFANSYIEQKAPWSLAKQGKTQELAAVMANLFESLRVVSILIEPFMPETSVRMRQQMGLDGAGGSCSGKDADIKVQKGAPLFPRLAK